MCLATHLPIESVRVVNKRRTARQSIRRKSESNPTWLHADLTVTSVQHWKQHREDCVPYGAELVRKGILLPFDSPTPQIVHVACKTLKTEDEDDPICHTVCSGQFIGPGRVYLVHRKIEFECFGPPSRRLDAYLDLIFSDTFAIDGSRPNKCAP